MSLACSGQLVVPTLLGKPRQQGNTVSVSRCSAVCPQKLALRITGTRLRCQSLGRSLTPILSVCITAAFGRRQCSWRLQRNSSCCVANATAEVGYKLYIFCEFCARHRGQNCKRSMHICVPEARLLYLITDKTALHKPACLAADTPE